METRIGQFISLLGASVCINVYFNSFLLGMATVCALAAVQYSNREPKA